MVIPLVDGMIVSRRALGKVFTVADRLQFLSFFNIFMNQKEVEIKK